jgi:hypothetical protein
VLDTHTWHWYQPQLAPSTPGLAPSPRAGHTATLVQIGSARKVFVFGGGDGNKIFNDHYLLDVEQCLQACLAPATASPRGGQLIWSKPHVKSSLPAARCAHTASTVDGALVVFGGGDGSRRFKDVYVLDLNALGDESTQATLLLSETTHQPSASIAINTARESVPSVTSPRTHSPSSDAPHSPQPHRHKPLKRSSSSSSISPQPVPSSPPDVVTWLGKLGLGKYADMFVKEEIDMALLPHLTERHLAENLHVPTLGARLRILNAIAALKEPPRAASPQPSRDHVKVQQLENAMIKLVSLISEASSIVIDRLATRDAPVNGVTGPGCPRDNGTDCK